MKELQKIWSLVLIALILVSSAGFSHVSHCNHCTDTVEQSQSSCCLAESQEDDHEHHSCHSENHLLFDEPTCESHTESCGTVHERCCYETVILVVFPFRNSEETIDITVPSFILDYSTLQTLLPRIETDTSIGYSPHDRQSDLAGRDVQTHFCTFLI